MYLYMIRYSITPVGTFRIYSVKILLTIWFCMRIQIRNQYRYQFDDTRNDYCTIIFSVYCSVIQTQKQCLYWLDHIRNDYRTISLFCTIWYYFKINIGINLMTLEITTRRTHFYCVLYVLITPGRIVQISSILYYKK